MVWSKISIVNLVLAPGPLGFWLRKWSLRVAGKKNDQHAVSGRRWRCCYCNGISSRVPRKQAKAISESLYEVIKQHGPISVANTWSLVKIILKWIREKDVKRFCTHHGSTKRFLHSILPEESQTVPTYKDDSPAPSSEAPKSSKKEKLRKDYKRLLEPPSVKTSTRFYFLLKSQIILPLQTSETMHARFTISHADDIIYDVW
ncbi:hypothetical protein M5K25_007688 [Dendrobium thyrsiflorum]|uniref:Uncharacterized protein n=1 Tax=Dendrobium thyrsiflorum TaxID=117978 RepID=A0ABD0VF03_DENTH